LSQFIELEIGRRDVPRAAPSEVNAAMSSAVRDRLARFYAPFNQALFRLLGQELPWSTEGV
jgi:hypothetical protein